jgi:hypothetical protein
MLAREPATEACSSVNPTVVPESLRLVQAHVVDVPSSSLVVLLHRPTEDTTSVVPHRLILEIRVLDKTARDRPRSFKDACSDSQHHTLLLRRFIRTMSQAPCQTKAGKLSILDVLDGRCPSK